MSTVEPDRTAPPSAAVYQQVQDDPAFVELRARYRRFAFPMTVAFLAWYLAYVLMSNYARDLMGSELLGEINVALVFGLLQFASTFVIAWLYSRHADRVLDPLAQRIREDVERSEAGR